MSKENKQMSIVLTVDIDTESQTVYIGEDNGSGCSYPYVSPQGVGDSVADYLVARISAESID